MLAELTGVHLIVIVAAIVLLFGATKLPIFAKSLGQTVEICRSELHPGADAAPVPAGPVTTSAP